MSGSEAVGPPWTVLKLLEWSKRFFAERGIDSPRLDAELLLAHVLGLSRVRLYMEHDRPLLPDELAAYRALVKRRAAREPVAYLTGMRGFWTLDLECDRRALVPRSDTEVLVEEALKRLPLDHPVDVLDIGTGSGAVALAIKSERPSARVVATDLDPEALELARTNAKRLGLDIDLRQADLLAGVPEQFGLIVSNPPYVAVRAEVDPEVAFEPPQALFAGPDGLDVIRRLIGEALAQLTPGGWLLFEHGFDQGDATRELLERAGYEDVTTRKDYSGQDRVACGRKMQV